MALEIRDYVARAKSDPSTQHIQDLWQAVFLLKGWYFLPAESREGCERPAVMLVDDEPWLVCFTNIRRLKAFSRATERAGKKGEFYLLVIDPRQAMRQIIEIEAHIKGVIFNPDSAATFRAPVHALRQYADHFGVPIQDSAQSSLSPRQPEPKSTSVLVHHPTNI